MAQLLLRGEPLGNFEGVLFDKDGTLSHSEPRLVEQGHSRINAACECFLADQKHRAQRDKEQIKQLEALLRQAYGLRETRVNPDGLLAVASRQHNLVSTATLFSLMGEPWPKALQLAERSFVEAAEARKQHKGNATDEPSPLLPGARAMLDQLKAAGLACAVISNDTRAGISAFLRGHQLETHMQGIWSAEDQPSKPNPAAVHQLCDQLGLRPERCVLIGDADSDLLMARQAGIGLGLGYTAGWEQAPALTEHHQLIHHWDELQVMPNQ